MDTPDLNKIFKRALQGKGPTGFQNFRDLPPTAKPTNGAYIQRLDDFLQKLEDYNGDYAHAAMYGHHALDDLLDADESDFEIGENVTPLSDEELKDLRFNTANDNSSDDLYQNTPEEFDFEHFRAQFFLFLQEGAGLLNIGMSDICESQGKDYHTLWDQYMMDQGDLDDGDLVTITAQLHGEVQAYKEVLTHGHRLTVTPISDYVDNKPLTLYKQDPEGITPA